MRTPLTKEGKEKLEGELQRLKNKERPAIIRAIATARAHGDLSENAEYTSAKEKQRFIEGRIKELEIILTAAEVIDPVAIGAGGRCIFGAYVEVENAEGKRLSYRLVSRHESNIDRRPDVFGFSGWTRVAGQICRRHNAGGSPRRCFGI